MRTKFSICLLLLIVLENLCLLFFYKKGWLTQQSNSTLFFLSGISLGLMLIAAFYNEKMSTEENVRLKKQGIPRVALLIVLLLSITWLYFLTTKTLQKIGIDKNYSDIIPAIQIMVKRFLGGAYPYSPMTELGYSTPAGYMPLHWMPFCVAELSHIDYRFVTFGIWCVAAVIVVVRSLRNTFPLQSSLVILLLTGLYYSIFLQSDDIISVTAELLIAGYYMMAIVGMNQNNAWMQGLFITLCLLSRYTLILWLPLWGFVLFVSGHQKQLGKALLVMSVATLTLYIIPFLSKDWSMFFTTAQAYSNLSWEWQHVDDAGRPYHLYDGIGFAYIFYEKYRNTDYMIGFQLLRKIFFALIISSIVLMGIWYWFKKEKIDYRVFLLASFKIYLSIFLSFIVVPYPYLMITGSFVSIAIFAEQLRYRVI